VILDSCLDYRTEHYAAERHLLWAVSCMPGYHTRIANGSRGHPTRENMDYALGPAAGEPI
jgi:hypothetical protein